MAILKAMPSHRNPIAIQQYLLQEKKIRNSAIAGFGTRADNFGKQFNQVQQLYGKTTGRRYYHYVLSFSPEETKRLSPSDVTEIGTSLAQDTFGKDGFQYIVVTHTDTDHLHSHIVVNAVNQTTGKKLHTTRKDLITMKERVNTLCHKHALQLIPKSEKKITNGEYWTDIHGKDVWKQELRDVIDMVRQQVQSYDDFKSTLEMEWGVIITRDNGIGMTYTHQNGNKVRGKKLGTAYDKPALQETFSQGMKTTANRKRTEKIPKQQSVKSLTKHTTQVIYYDRGR